SGGRASTGCSRKVDRTVFVTAEGPRPRAGPATFAQFQTARPDLPHDAKQRRAILEQTGEPRLPPVELVHHRGKGGERCVAEAAGDPNAVEVGASVHATHPPARPGSAQGLNQV